MHSIKCRICQQFKDETSFDYDKSGTRYEACNECKSDKLSLKEKIENVQKEWCSICGQHITYSLDHDDECKICGLWITFKVQ